MSGNALRDRGWIERIQRGDDVAFAELFVAYYPMLCEFVRCSVRSDEDAEEAVDDVLFSLWQGGAENVPLDSVAPYLFAAVRNRVYMAIRSRERRWRREDVYMRDVEASRGPEGGELSSGDADRIGAVRSVVETLPERCRKIFILRWTAHLSYAEIARTMDVSEKTVENQLAIAMKRIRDAVK